jgi:hypothetical protein
MPTAWKKDYEFGKDIKESDLLQSALQDLVAQRVSAKAVCEVLVQVIRIADGTTRKFEDPTVSWYGFRRIIAELLRTAERSREQPKGGRKK